MTTRRALLLAAGACGLPAWAQGPAAPPVEVAVRLIGERVVIDVRAVVEVHRAVAWEVLTDYAHQPAFIGNLKTSVVLSRKGNLLLVEQSGEASRGFLHFAFSAVRSVELMPEREIVSHLVRGDFKSFDFTTRLDGDLAGPVTITHHGDYVPLRWVPPVIGPALIESETRKQYGELMAEMARREGRLSSTAATK